MGSKIRKTVALINANVEDAEGFRQELNNGSDRACALVGAAYIDVRLSNLIRKFLVDDAKIVDELFENQGPLSTFSGKIKLAYCMGLISRDNLNNFHIIRDIRNGFAHSIHGLTFDTEAIATECDKLTLAKHKNDKSFDLSKPRKIYTWTVIFAMLRLSYLIHEYPFNKCEVLEMDG